MSQNRFSYNHEKIKTRDILDIFKEIKNSGGKVAVAVEGGGLRGIVSASILSLFEDLGLGSQIDAVAGTSAGAINLSYFLNNNMKSCLNLYKTLASPKFIQPFSWPNAMNMSFLFNEQIPLHFPIDWNHLRNQQIPFYITATDVNSGKGVWLKAQDAKADDELIKYVRASSSAPLFTTNKESIDGKLYNDGQVEFSIPYLKFIEEDYDLIFCLLTRPRGYKKTQSLGGNIFEKIALRKYSNQYKKQFTDITQNYNYDLDRLFKNKLTNVVPLAIDPSDFINSKMTKNPNDIQRCIDAVYKRFT